MRPVINSTAGYCHEILLLQAEHLPRRNTKLKIGTSSKAQRAFPHEKHCDRPFGEKGEPTIDIPVL